MFTVLPHFVLRYRQMRAWRWLAMPSWRHTVGSAGEWCAVIDHLSPMVLYRLIGALGSQSLVAVLTCNSAAAHLCPRRGEHRHGLTDRVYLPTIVRGRVPLASGVHRTPEAVAFTQSYGEFQHGPPAGPVRSSSGAS